MLSSLEQVHYLFQSLFMNFRFVVKHRHLGENAQLAVVKRAGHAISAEKSKEFNKHIMLFLIDFKRSQISPSANHQNNTS